MSLALSENKPAPSARAMAQTAPEYPETPGISPITLLLIGFGILIVIGQLIPSMVMLYGMIRGLFGIEATQADKHVQSTNRTLY